MKSDSLPIIEFKNIYKQYSVRKKRDNKQNYKYSLTALNNINLTISRGDIICIIGKNGSGKSTLLKLINELTPPSKGEIVIRGSVSGMIEGSGSLQPDLTGWDNIMITGKLLGLSTQELKERGKEIIDFSELHEFIHSPVKNYSSGMKLRLSFAITVYLNADILLFDEVFSVGDYNFQQKCILKLFDLINKGKTILIVTHNFKLIEYCKKTIILDEGKIVDYTETSKIIKNNTDYFSLLYKSPAYKTIFNNEVSIDKNIIIHSSEIYNGTNNNQTICMNDPLEIKTEFEIISNQYVYTMGYVILQHGISVMAVNSVYAQKKPVYYSEKGVYNSVTKIPGNIFNSGIFSLDIYIYKMDPSGNASELAYVKKNVFIFSIEIGNYILPYSASFMGPMQPMTEWIIKYSSTKII